ncbi:protein gamma response 1-like [Phragmites australis]|uniref:protein gamma response 1-like n=1 Tax=Phragmites australis TaxID=29695 RepID=UPI002D7880E5|nr:protein gamma response 1-like [Phragmites australis]
MEGKVVGIDRGGASGDAADDLKYISGLSTILVATIQEVKDRVSQMEFIFCSQLFPHFQAKSKLLQARLADADAVKASEDEWRKREAGLVSQLEELSRGKRDAEERLLRMGSSLEETKGKLVDAERVIARREADKKQIMGRLEEEMRKGEVVRRLEREIEEKAAELAKGREVHQRLLQQVEMKDKDLIIEQSKRRDLIEDYTQLKTNYKHLKSQYTFLLGKINQNEGSKFPVGIPVDGKSFESSPSKRKIKDLENTSKESIQEVSKTRDLKNDSTSCAKAQAAQHASSVRSPFSNSRLALPSRPTNQLPNKAASNSKLEALSSVTSPSLHWRETRARKEPGVADPHDDFLDTPLEAVKNTIRNHTTPEEAQALAASPPQDMEFNNSDDETQDMNIANQGLKNIPNMLVPKQQNKISIQPSKKDFKYRESVRKKADRENLKGVECKQCKKFYDAVLPDGRVNGDGVGSTSLKCEHHDGVSRHRYRYAPPLTPEGFWNIGFESEM